MTKCPNAYKNRCCTPPVLHLQTQQLTNGSRLPVSPSVETHGVRGGSWHDKRHFDEQNGNRLPYGRTGLLYNARAPRTVCRNTPVAAQRRQTAKHPERKK